MNPIINVKPTELYVFLLKSSKSDKNSVQSSDVSFGDITMKTSTRTLEKLQQKNAKNDVIEDYKIVSSMIDI